MAETLGLIKNYRRSRKSHTPNQAIIIVEGIDSKQKASALVGKKVSFQASKETAIAGKIMSAHGDNGAVRAKFDKGLPGQALGQKVSII